MLPSLIAADSGESDKSFSFEACFFVDTKQFKILKVLWCANKITKIGATKDIRTTIILMHSKMKFDVVNAIYAPL